MQHHITLRQNPVKLSLALYVLQKDGRCVRQEKQFSRSSAAQQFIASEFIEGGIAGNCKPVSVMTGRGRLGRLMSGDKGRREMGVTKKSE